MEYKANSGVWGTMFGVPCVVADNFLKLATGEQIKALLYILRCSGRNCTDEEIALNTGISVQQAADAILFWEQVNVLTPNSTAAGSSIMSAPQLTAAPAPEPQPAPELKNDEAPKAVPRAKQNLNPSEIAQAVSDSKDISELFKIAESALGPLSHTQQNSLIWMHSYLGLKTEVIITLLYYCMSIEKTNSGYIEKIACTWAENDINSLESAQEEVQRLTSYNDFTGKIMKKFEMIRRPTPKQNDFIEQWKKEDFSLELIGHAYEKT
ncbi:MAG: DnaD domain protein, partial [Ruminococcus sp.]|nr:DnaD domain protein [Ruminococcus sp.]